MRRLLASALVLLLAGLLGSACGGDDDTAAEATDDPAAATDGANEPDAGEDPEEPVETDEPTEAPECEGIITFEELSAIVGIEIDRCEQGGFFRGKSPDGRDIANLNIRVRGSGPSSLDDIEGAGWTGDFTAGICATEAPIGKYRYVVQDLQFNDDCKGLTAEIMDAIAARLG